MLNKVVLFSLLLFSAPVLPQNCMVRVLAADSAGWMLRLNGKTVSTPLDTLLPSGNIIVNWNRIGEWSGVFESGYEQELTCQQKLVWLVNPSGHLLATFPPGAAIYNNDSLLGFSPLRVTGSKVNLSLRKNGYRSVTLNADSLNAAPVINLQALPGQSGARFYLSDEFPYLLAGIAVLGSVAAVYKIKADNAYALHRQVNNPGALSTTRKYDLISGISFALLQVNFGYLIYQFVTE